MSLNQPVEIPLYTSRYLPVEEDALRWGLQVMDTGTGVIEPNSPYPQSPHPEKYLFSWKNGRTLQEYQLVYITRGQGIFESEPTGRVRITEGQVFLLYPGIWHRYHPARKTGWDENWIGFNGETADRIMKAFFPPDSAVISVGYDQRLHGLIRSVAERVREAPPGYQQLIAADTLEALALVRSRSMSYHASDREGSKKVQQAREFLLARSAEDVKVEDLAKDLGLSYSRFRTLFRERTGSSPHQYLLSIRINKARDLLLYSKLTIAEIAETSGFSSAYYFSRLFQQKVGCAPTQFRNQSR